MSRALSLGKVREGLLEEVTLVLGEIVSLREYFESAATGPGTREEGGVFWLLSSQNNPHLRADSPASPRSCHCAFPGQVPVTLEQSLPCPVPPGGKSG